MSEGELPAWMSGKAKKKKINQRSRKQENKRAKEIGGRTQAGSGSSYRAPEDVVGSLDELGHGPLEQLKFTDAKGYRLTVDEWRRLERHAIAVGRQPVLVIDFEQHGLRLVIRAE